MAIKLLHSDYYSTYFCTFTCHQWISLFEITKAYDTVYNWFNHVRILEGVEIVSYVIMPNHLHFIIHFSINEFNLNKIIAEAKRFVAYELINRLERAQHNELLQLLKNAVSEREKKKGQLHKVFKESFDAKAIFSDKFLLQKMEYIHHNPVSGKWNLVNNFTDYEHSSASFYELGTPKHFTPKHYKDL